MDEERYAVDRVCEDVQSDNEAALLTLVREALKTLRYKDEHLETLTAEKSHEYDSQSDGPMGARRSEVAIRDLRGQMRVMESALEARIGYSIPVNHPILTWMVPCAATLINAKRRGEDGMTPWTRIRGRRNAVTVWGLPSGLSLYVDHLYIYICIHRYNAMSGGT